MKRVLDTKAPKGTTTMIKSRAMEKLFKLERSQTEAALTIQKAWRR